MTMARPKPRHLSRNTRQKMRDAGDGGGAEQQQAAPEKTAAPEPTKAEKKAAVKKAAERGA